MSLSVLIFGGKGWIGGLVSNYLEKLSDITVYHSQSRADDEEAVEKEILQLKPDRLLSLIGRTFGPGYSTIDYLEQKGKLVENLRDNLYGPLVLALLAKKHNLHLTYLGTGCIFNGYQDNVGYTESDKPDFFGSAYSTTKGYTDRIMHMLEDSVLNVRIRMPITSEPGPRNFITKIMTYKKICSIPNSMTVLSELIPIMIDLMVKRETGTINLTNPGVITHNEILEMVREIINPDFTWENFTLEEQNQILLSERSNNLLNTDKLQQLYPNVRPIKEAIRGTLIEMKQYL
jgi:dTDP-4-dehydrorhamnose reductase